jgi:hypothetical protein
MAKEKLDLFEFLVSGRASTDGAGRQVDGRDIVGCFGRAAAGWRMELDGHCGCVLINAQISEVSIVVASSVSVLSILKGERTVDRIALARGSSVGATGCFLVGRGDKGLWGLAIGQDLMLGKYTNSRCGQG